MDADRVENRPGRKGTEGIRRFGAAWVFACGASAAILTAVLRQKLYDACALPHDAGYIQPMEGWFVMFVVLPVTAVGIWILAGATYALMTRRPSRIMYAAPLVALIPCLLIVWAMLAWSFGDPIGNVVCPTGYPGWWPTWMPL